jgi:hypothetical protein
MSNLRGKDSWKEFMELYKRSGLSRAEFCRSQKITEGKYYYYSKLHRVKDEHAVTAGQTVKKSNFIGLAANKEFKIKINDTTELSFETLPEPAWMASLIKFIGNSHATL